MKRTITALAVAALLVASVGAYAALGGAERGSPPRAVVAEPSPVRISGHVEGLYPGGTTTLPLRAQNRTDGWVRLQRLKANVRSPSTECASGNLQTEVIRPRLLIPPGQTRDLQLEVSLASSAPDACQAARFPLRYRTRVETLVSAR